MFKISYHGVCPHRVRKCNLTELAETVLSYERFRFQSNCYGTQTGTGTGNGTDTGTDTGNDSGTDTDNCNDTDTGTGTGT